jgi:hypothetical protein
MFVGAAPPIYAKEASPIIAKPKQISFKGPELL